MRKLILWLGLTLIGGNVVSAIGAIPILFNVPSSGGFNIQSYNESAQTCYSGAGAAIWGYPNNVQSSTFKISPTANPLADAGCYPTITWQINPYNACLNASKGSLNSATASQNTTPAKGAYAIYYTYTLNDGSKASYNVYNPNVSSSMCSNIFYNGATYNFVGCTNTASQISCCFTSDGTTNGCT